MKHKFYTRQKALFSTLVLVLMTSALPIIAMAQQGKEFYMRPLLLAPLRSVRNQRL